MNSAIELSVACERRGEPFKHFWNFCVGAGRANEGLRADWQEQLKLAVEQCGFKYVRFHGLFHDDMFVYREVNGSGVYNWQYVDALFDAMLDIGVRPFVELGFCPGPLASQLKTVFWWGGHGSPPKDYSKWAELVGNFVRHCLSRYGLDEVRKWYFEVWNEPNLHPFFTGTKSQYFELYKTSAKVIKQISPELRVGGPATSNFVPDERFDGEAEDVSRQITHQTENLDSLSWKGVWIEDFLAYCVKENLPLDFLSTHPYPTDFALDGHGRTTGRTRGVNSTRDDLTWLRNIIDRSAYPDAEIHLTEWSSSPSSRDYSHDYLPAGAFVLKTNLDSRRLVDSLSYWVFTDVFEEGGAGNTIFHGGFGLINFQGIVKPTFHAYRFLNSLGDEELAAADGAFVSRDSITGRIAVAAYNYPSEMPQVVPMAINDREKAEAIMNTGSDKRLHLTLTGLRPGSKFMLERIDGNHGFALAAWKKMGMPEPPDRVQTALLRQAAFNTGSTEFTVGHDGTFEYNTVLKPWSFILIKEE